MYFIWLLLNCFGEGRIVVNSNKITAVLNSKGGSSKVDWWKNFKSAFCLFTVQGIQYQKGFFQVVVLALPLQI